MRGARQAAVAAGLLVLTVGAGAQPQRPDPRSGLIVGQVVDAANGRPVAGAVVSIGGSEGASGGSRAGRSRGQASPEPPPRILTGSDGRFVFRDLPRGSFTINSNKAGYSPGAYGRRRPRGPSSQVELEAGDRVGGIVVPMWKNGSISGMVLDESAEAVAGVQLRAFRRVVVSGRRTFTSAGAAMTDDRGTYRFGDITPGEYVVAASLRHDAVPLVMSTSGAPSAAGRGGGSGRVPLPGSAGSIQVGDVLYGLGRGNPTPPPPIDDRLFVYPPTFHPSSRSLDDALPVSVASGQDRTAIDLQLQPAPAIRVSGVVFGPDGAADGQAVRLMPDDRDHDIGAVLDAPSATADINGVFVFGAVPEGQYSLRAIGRQRRPPGPVSPKEPDPLLWADVPISAGQEDLAGIPVVLRHGLRVHGRFTFDGSRSKPSPRELTQIAIAVEPADGGAQPASGAPHIDIASGEFSTAGVPGGRYIVKVTASPVGWMFKAALYGGRDISLSPVEMASGDLFDVVLQFTDRWSGVQGHVTNAKGGLDPGASVLLFPAESDAWTSYGGNPRRLRSVRPDPNGGYVINSVPPGDYFVVAVPDEQTADWQDPVFLDKLTGIAEHISIGEGDKITQSLRTQEVR